MEIERMQASDWSTVARIYRAGIETGHATFEVNVPVWKTFDATRHERPRLVAREDDRVVGFAALTPASTRAVYNGVADIMIYVDAPDRGRGVGGQLLAALITGSEENGIWTLQAGIFPENEASLRLHRAHGFRDVGRRERIAQRDGVWRDVLWLERRSTTVGV